MYVDVFYNSWAYTGTYLRSIWLQNRFTYCDLRRRSIVYLTLFTQLIYATLIPFYFNLLFILDESYTSYSFHVLIFHRITRDHVVFLFIFFVKSFFLNAGRRLLDKQCKIPIYLFELNQTFLHIEVLFVPLPVGTALFRRSAKARSVKVILLLLYGWMMDGCLVLRTTVWIQKKLTRDTQYSLKQYIDYFYTQKFDYKLCRRTLRGIGRWGRLSNYLSPIDYFKILILIIKKQIINLVLPGQRTRQNELIFVSFFRWQDNVILI